MASEFFDNPPTLSGTEKDQLQQLYGYLSIVSDKLNNALMNVSIEQLAPETRTIIVGETEKQGQQNFEQLKSLIIKTAEIVRTEMDEIRTQLNTDIEAISSDFGTFRESIQTDITATAAGIRMEISDQQTIITELKGETESYISNTKGYIHTGIIGYKPTGEAILGVAVGQGHVTNADGTLNSNDRVATFTADKMSFYNGGNEVAYFSSNKFYITHGEVTQTMTMGDYTWRVFTDHSLGLVAD